MSGFKELYLSFLVLVAIGLISGFSGFALGAYLFTLLSLPMVIGGVIGAIIVEGAALSYALAPH